MKTLSLTLAFLTAVSLASAGEVKFSTKPAVSRAGKKLTISFAVSGKIFCAFPSMRTQS